MTKRIMNSQVRMNMVLGNLFSIESHTMNIEWNFPISEHCLEDLPRNLPKDKEIRTLEILFG